MDIAEVRQKYPQYGDVSDEDLARGLHQKFYSDLPFDDFAAKIGYKAPPSTLSKVGTAIGKAANAAADTVSAAVNAGPELNIDPTGAAPQPLGPPIARPTKTAAPIVSAGPAEQPEMDEQEFRKAQSASFGDPTGKTPWPTGKPNRMGPKAPPIGWEGDAYWPRDAADDALVGGAGSGIESFVAMPIQIAGAGAGALGTGAGIVAQGVRAAMGNGPAPTLKQAAGGVSEGMAEGGDKMSLAKPVFAQTPALNKLLTDTFEGVRSGVGTAAEGYELLRGAFAQGVTPEALHQYVKARPEAARTLAEFGVDASIAVSPLTQLESFGRRRYQPDYTPKPEPTAGPRMGQGGGTTYEGTAQRIDEDAPQVTGKPPPAAPAEPAGEPQPPAGPAAPPAPTRGSMGDLEAVMADDRPLGQIRADQIAQQAAAAAPEIAEAAASHAEQQTVEQAGQQLAVHASGVPEAGQRALVRWPDGETAVVTVLDPYANGAQVQTAEGEVMDLTTQDVSFEAAPAGSNTPASPVMASEPQHVAEAAKRVDTEATDAQKDAGNYRKGHVNLQGLDITIENPMGSVRRSTDAASPWEVDMPAHYGYVKRTEGADGEHVDVYIGDHPSSDKVFIIDQIDPKTGAFDEVKAMLGFSSKPHAVATYHTAFNDGSGPSRIGAISQVSVDEFKEWLKSGDTTAPMDYSAPVETKQPIAETIPAKSETIEAKPETKPIPPTMRGQMNYANKRLPEGFEFQPMEHTAGVGLFEITDTGPDIISWDTAKTIATDPAWFDRHIERAKHYFDEEDENVIQTVPEKGPEVGQAQPVHEVQTAGVAEVRAVNEDGQAGAGDAGGAGNLDVPRAGRSGVGDTVLDKPPPGGWTAADKVPPALPKKASREAIDKLAERVDTMSPAEKEAAAKWLDDEIQRQEEEGRRIAMECEG